MMDRAEAKGFGVALAGHGALLAALSLGLANVRQPPLMNDPMEVSFVDEVALTSASPSTAPPPPSVAPDLGPPDEPAPAPVIEPAPAPPLPAPPKAAEARPVPKPAPKPEPAKSAPAKAQPKPAPAKAQPAKSASGSGKAEQPRGSRLGSDFLKGLGSDSAPARAQQPSGAVMSAVAMAGIVAAIKRQIQPCADRQVDPGPGANRIEVKLNLRLNRDGSLTARPRVVSTSGVDDENARYEKRVTDLAIAAFTGCAPLRDLPDELYQTPKGGWSNFNMNYKLPD